jgi:hypothetical protein
MTLVQTICAWIYSNRLYQFFVRYRIIPEFFKEFITNIILDQAWKDGYCAAVIELAEKRSIILDAIGRKIAKKKIGFLPIYPTLLVYDVMMYDEWDAGYERAILLWRLCLVPKHLMEIGHTLAKRSTVPIFDALIDFTYTGDMKADPRIWYNSKGLHLPIRQEYLSAKEKTYRDYSITFQQVRGGHLQNVEKECYYCARISEDCICKEIADAKPRIIYP